MRSSNVGNGNGLGPEGFGGASGPDPRPGSTTQKQTLAGPLIGLNRDEPRPTAGPRRTRNSPDGNAPPEISSPEALVNIPFIVDHETGRITKFGQPCLVERNGKPVPLSPREFSAAALLIENMGQYVPMETLCSRLQAHPAHVQRIMTPLRQALGLGSNHNLRGSSLVLMSDGYRTRGYGIFIAPRLNDDRAANDSPRGMSEALLSDLEAAAEADLTVLSADDGTIVIRLEDQTARLHIGTITGRATPMFYMRAAPESPPSEPANDLHDVMIGWNADRSVYGLKRLGRSNRIANVLLDDAKASGLAYSLDLSADVEHGIFTVESIFAAQPENLTTALKQYLEHQRSQADGIPSNVTTQRDAQTMILQHLGVTRHGLLGVNPLPLYDLPAPFPPRALLYVNQIAQHNPGRLGIRIRRWFDGRKQGPVANFYQRKGVATLVLGLYELDDTMLVVAWDPASHPELKGAVLSVDEETLRSARRVDAVVSESRHQLAGRHSEEVLAAPLEHLDKLIEARLRPHPKQRMIDALGGDSCVREHLNAHTWTMVVDGRLFHVQWCGPLLRGDAPPHIRPFSMADRFVAPDPDAVALHAGHDPEKDVVVLWRQAPGEPMHKDIVFSVPDSTLDEAMRTGIATHVTHIGRTRLALRKAAAAKYETGPLMSAVSHLSHEPDHREIWRSRSADIHEPLFEHLQPIEWSDWERARTRPWPIAVELPTLGAQSLDVFAYRAKVSDTQTGSIAIVIRPVIPRAGGRTSLFAAGREPVLLGEWDGIYILFDPSVRPTIQEEPHILITASRDHLEAARTQGLALMTRQHRYGEFEETIIFATGERLLEALDLRLRTLPKVNVKRIVERLDMNDPQALAEVAMRLQRAMRLPDRDALTGTRDAPRTMVIVTGPPKGIKVIDVKNAIRRALQTKRTTDGVLWLHSPETERSVLLHAGLRAVLQMSEGLRWPAQEQFDVLWALMQAAAHEGTVSDELVRTACHNSLQWLFIGWRAPFRLHRHTKPGSYQVRVRQTVAGDRTRPSITLPAYTLDRVFNHASLFAARRARPDIVWAFIKKVGPARIVPNGSGDDVVFELDGQRIWVYGLTNTLHRSEDSQTDYVAPALSPEQLSKIESHPDDRHILAAFDPGRGTHAWVFWSARPHLGQLRDPGYRLHVSADLPDNAGHEWRQLDANREERVILYRERGQGPGIGTLLKQLTVELPQERIAAFEAEASKGGLTFGQVLSAMRPVHQIAMAMRYGLAPYDRRYRTAEIEDRLGIKDLPTSAMFQHAAHLARTCLEAGEPLPELAEIVRLLRDPRAEQFMGSRILLSMLRKLYGLEPGVKPASLTEVFRDRGLHSHALHALYRELVMRLIRGANEHGVSTMASFDIGTAVRRGALPSATQIAVEIDPAMPPSTQSALAGEPTPEGGRRVAHDDLATTIALPDSDQLATNHASAIAALRQARRAIWPQDVELPVALAQLPPDIELIMRAYLGVWPYLHRYTVEQVTAEFDIGTQARSKRLIRLASDELLAHAESLSGIVLPAKEPRPTLERLAALLIDRADMLTDDEVNAVLARHGLATAAPLVTETTRQGVLSEFRPSLQYRRAVKKLTGNVVLRAAEMDEDELYWPPELIREIYKRIDAGEYARLQLLLRNPATRDETFSDMVLRGVAAVDQRAAHRTSAIRGIRLNTMVKRQTTLDYEDAVTRALGFDPSIETFLQRANELDAVLDRALAITDEETQWLQRVVDDGDLAFKEFLGKNSRLAHAVAVRVGYADDVPGSSEILDDAISGLLRAIWGYNPEMSLSFSSYAIPTIRSRVFQLSAIRYAQRLDVPFNRAQEIIMTRVARARLRKQAAGHEPKLEELARAVLVPQLRRRLASQLKTEPTATQLQSDWGKYLPELLRRIEENVEFVNAYDRITHALSLDRTLFDMSDRTFHDIVASKQQLAPPFPGHEPDRSGLDDYFKAVLDRAGLDNLEQFVLRHRFGIAGYTQLLVEEIAANRSISEGTVSDIVASAFAKIRRSSEAQMLLMPYLQRERNIGS